MADRPLGVTLLAILWWINALTSVIAFFDWDNRVNEWRDNGLITQDQADLMIDNGWGILVVALIFFLFGLGLWKLVNIIRILQVIFFAFFALTALVTMISAPLFGFLLLIISVALIWYMLKDSTHRAFTA